MDYSVGDGIVSEDVQINSFFLAKILARNESRLVSCYWYFRHVAWRTFLLITTSHFLIRLVESCRSFCRSYLNFCHHYTTITETRRWKSWFLQALLLMSNLPKVFSGAKYFLISLSKWRIAGKKVITAKFPGERSPSMTISEHNFFFQLK